MDKIVVGLLFCFLFHFSVTGLFYYCTCNCVGVSRFLLYVKILHEEAGEREESKESMNE